MSKDKLITNLKERLHGHSEVFLAGAAKGYRMALEDITKATNQHEKEEA